MNNLQKRQARTILRQLVDVISAVPRDALPYVARGLAQGYNIPAKVMLREMARYTRLYR